jgi:protein SCO1
MRIGRFLAAVAALFAASCSKPGGDGHITDVTGALPALDFSMTRVNDGRAVTAADYRGKVALLYFGYTHCPDVCPTTLSNLAEVLQKLGPRADGARVLFVTVDPDRDTPAVMKKYVGAFGPGIDGLAGTPDQLVALTRRYRVAFSVTKGPPYDVMHSNTVFVFAPDGRARLVMTDTAQIDELTAAVRGLLSGP